MKLVLQSVGLPRTGDARAAAGHGISGGTDKGMGRRWAARLSDETGSYTVMSLFVVVAMCVCFGFAIDFMRAESVRARLQGTLDQAVLAAASKHSSIDPSTGQPRAREEIARSYFEAAGVSGTIPTITAHGDCNDSYVEASALLDVKTTYLGIDILGPGHASFPAPAAGRASESLPRVEVSLVLDMSSSMGRNNRMTNLRPAAKEFVTTMLDTPCQQPNVTISVIPFATQVTAGPRLLQEFDVTAEHGYSHCVDFGPEAFNESIIDDDPALQRTSPINPWDVEQHTDEAHFVCSPSPNREILPWSADRTQLHDYIDALPVGGNTSMDIGAKWGLAMLDPTLRPSLRDFASEGLVNSYYRDRPYNYVNDRYSPGDAIKVMVVMSDGANTEQYYLQENFRSGPSRIWHDGNGNYSTEMGRYFADHPNWSPGDAWDPSVVPGSSIRRWSNGSRNANGPISERDTFRVYYDHSLSTAPGDVNALRPYPKGADVANFSYENARYTQQNATRDRLALYGAYEMDFPEVFQRVPLYHWAVNLEAAARGGNGHSQWNAALRLHNRLEKDERLSRICREARRNDVQVFAISFEAPPEGRRALLDCANGGRATSRYFDVQGAQIRDAFASIAQQVNVLRLTR